MSTIEDAREFIAYGSSEVPKNCWETCPAFIDLKDRESLDNESSIKRLAKLACERGCDGSVLVGETSGFGLPIVKCLALNKNFRII